MISNYCNRREFLARAAISGTGAFFGMKLSRADSQNGTVREHADPRLYRIHAQSECAVHIRALYSGYGHQSVAQP